MKTSSSARLVAPLLLAASLLGFTGCDKVSQCNELVNTINAHKPKLSAAVEKLSNVEASPDVADDYHKAVQAAADAVAALEFKDEKIAGFAAEYGTLLETAKGLAPAMKNAKADATQLQAAVAEVDKIEKMESTLVSEVNAYCSAS